MTINCIELNQVTNETLTKVKESLEIQIACKSLTPWQRTLKENRLCEINNEIKARKNRRR